MEERQQIMHIHGGSSFDSYEQYIENMRSWKFKKDDSYRLKRWSRNYRKNLDNDSYQIFTPTMPSKDNAKYFEWKIWFEKSFKLLRDDIVLVGHSLGGIFLAKYLSENKFPVSIKQLHLVAAVYEHEDDTEQLDDFKLTEFPGKLPKKNIPEIHIYHSSDDSVVPVSESKKYHAQIPGSHLHMFEDRFHFIGETFPELFENIKRAKKI